MNSTRQRGAAPNDSRGIVLLDALIAIVIFSIGILGMMSLQSNAVSLSADAQYRTEAAMLADRIIGEMWVAPQTTLATDFSSPSGARYVPWSSLVEALPEGESTVVVTADGLATVTINWTQPGDSVEHEYQSVTQVSY